ncbi:DUF2125 domain-containing protein [Cereibacter sphaeroides]|nr:DUF2125 domain-containing protein [Cereibacter sphaeroides]
MRAIKGLTVLAVLAVLAWGAYWFIGVRALDRAIAAGLAHRPEVQVDRYEIHGFPNRFDVTFDAPRIEAAGVSWSTPFLQLFALTYKPQHLVAVMAPDQILNANGQELLIHSEDLRASLVMQPSLDLPLERLAVVGHVLDLQLADETHALDTLRLGTRRLADRVHEVALVAEGLFPDPALMDRLDPQVLWPRRFERLRASAELEFDRVLDRHLADGVLPRLTRVTLTGFDAAWPGVDVTATGRLTPGPDGMLSGDVTLQVTGWEALLDELRQAGMLDDGTQAMLLTTLGSMTTEGNDQLDIPLTVAEGDLRLGPLLLGTLPRLRLPA